MTTERWNKPLIERIESNRLHAVWIVEYLSVIGHAHLATKCLSGRIIYTKETGKGVLRFYMKLITSQSLQEEFVRLLVKNRVFFLCMMHLLQFVKTKHQLQRLHL